MNIFRIFFVLLVAYALYNIITYSQSFRKMEEINPFPEKNCEKINYKFPIETFIKIDDNTFIGSSDNYLKLFYEFKYVKENIDQGNLVKIDILNKSISILQIEKFPDYIPFHPQGMDLYKEKYLFVINHSLGEEIDSERIEIIKINKDPLSLEYMDSIILPNRFLGKLKSIAVINKDNFYFSTNKFFDIPTKESHSFFQMFINKMYLEFAMAFNLKLSFLFLYTKGKIIKIAKSRCILGNGLAYDSKNKLLFFSQSIEQSLQVYKINDTYRPQFNRTIYLGFAGDNLYFNKINKILNVGIFCPVIKYGDYISRNNDRTKLKGYFGGLIEIDVENNYEISVTQITKDSLMAISSAYMENNFTIFSSSIDNGTFYCEFKYSF